MVNISDSTISTKQNTSGGIHVAGGGTLYANNLDVATEGESAAAIRSDRGGGTMIVDQGTYTSNGVGSPAVYCTADIAVNNATLTATGSEAICMEGLNNLYLYDCDISGDMQDLETNDTTWDIIVYQSMSGDAEVGNATMQIVGGSLEAKNGGLIYTTNTQSNILLSDVDITYSDDSEFFLMATGNTNSRGWGNEGENGADCTFTADSQEMSGKVIWVGAYWQKSGKLVVPTVSWGLSRSYEFCFDGIEKHCIVAVGMIGCKGNKKSFLRGYYQMLRKIEPEAIICLGEPFEEMKENIIKVDYLESRKVVR